MKLAPVIPLSTARAPLAPELLRVDHVERRYGRLVALHDLSLSIRRGETLGLLGPNGAGKSTLMNLLVGADAPNAGSITLDGLAVAHRAARARIGIAPQEIALYGELTAAENLAFAGRMYGLSGAWLEERTEHALKLAELVPRRDDRVHTFSGGMQRRLNLACAVVHEPDLLLLDEPTVGVDPQSRSHIFQALEQLRSLGVTIVYSTHYMEEAERLCDRIAIVDHGRILAQGTLAELTEAHGRGHIVQVEFDPAWTLRPSARYVTREPWQVVNELARSNAPIASLHIERPSLEGVFLTLTGRSLRD